MKFMPISYNADCLLFGFSFTKIENGKEFRVNPFNVFEDHGNMLVVKKEDES